MISTHSSRPLVAVDWMCMIGILLNFSFFFYAAVAVNAKLQYAVVEICSPTEDASLQAEDKKLRLGNVLKGEKKPFLVVASDLVPALKAKWGLKLSIKKLLLGSHLEHCRF